MSNSHQQEAKINSQSIESGNLISYNNIQQWDVFLKKAYIDKNLKMAKWPNGKWKYVLIVGDFPPAHKVVEFSNKKGIYTIPKSIIYEYKPGYNGKRWK